MTPRTKAEFEQYTTLVLDRFSDFEKFREYPGFLDTLARRLCEKLTKVEDIRKVSSTLNALANDRQRAEKEAAKKGKKTNTKKQVRVDAGDEMVPTARGVGGGLGEEAEAGAYYAGDDYDFM
ncbi:eukaryotic translation initiation factor 3 subunit J [Blastocladiella britannica]|nr:eukaryotic translation initiation factor 3 subunit J [Blastocladiella britannica]